MKRWDIFCRVVDNLGDAGVCWRLACQLQAEYSIEVRLWIDAPKVLRRLVPELLLGETSSPSRVQIKAWTHEAPPDPMPACDMADVVIAAFACELPPAYRAAMRERPPVWINLEYLSFETWARDCHGLPSPKADGLIEHFFFPGPDTGGLLRETGLLDEQARFRHAPDAREQTLAGLGLQAAPDDRFCLVFCYPDSPLQALREALASDPRPGRWRLLLPRGSSPGLDSAGFETIPFVPQARFDAVLWSCDLLLVRGEDSLVRALWSGQPLLWQAYRQDDEARQHKVEAFMQHWEQTARPSAQAAHAWRQLHQAWNRRAPQHAEVANTLAALLPHLEELGRAGERWVAHQGVQADLAARLVTFVSDRI